jgi:hypothetical protein
MIDNFKENPMTHYLVHYHIYGLVAYRPWTTYIENTLQRCKK